MRSAVSSRARVRFSRSLTVFMAWKGNLAQNLEKDGLETDLWCNHTTHLSRNAGSQQRGSLSRKQLPERAVLIMRKLLSCLTQFI